MLILSEDIIRNPPTDDWRCFLSPRTPKIKGFLRPNTVIPVSFVNTTPFSAKNQGTEKQNVFAIFYPVKHAKDNTLSPLFITNVVSLRTGEQIPRIYHNINAHHNQYACQRNKLIT